MLQILLPAVAGPIATLLNISIITGVFPSSWKIRQVIPVYKKEMAQSSCLPILCCGVDCLNITYRLLVELSLCYTTFIGRCFKLSWLTLVRNILRFMGSMPLFMMFEQCRLLLIKSCITCSNSLLFRIYKLTACNKIQYLIICFK